jgi:hypothetical protein
MLTEWNEDTAQYIPKLSTRWSLLASFMPLLLYQLRLPVPIVYEAGWAPDLICKFGNQNMISQSPSPQPCHYTNYGMPGQHH